MTKLSYTDSKNRDFEFWIDGNAVSLYYIISPKPKLKTKSLYINLQSVEEGKFPDFFLIDFEEACMALKTMVNNMAFI